MANSVDPDQMPHSVYTVCSGLSVPIARINAVFLDPVQSIVSLMSSLVVKILTVLVSATQLFTVIFAEKATHIFFSKDISI